MSGRVWLVCTLLVLFLATFNNSLAQEKTRPQVGLVLSGGGAKGIAHIGVIKALEENGIPFDCVAGTSAGAIVGSLYACGWSPEEILALFTSDSFKYWSSGTISQKNVYYQTQSDPTPAWADVGLNLGKDKKGLDPLSQIIPTNLISPIPMNLEFLELYTPYTKQCKENFDNLFVPLRTVCSDVYHKHKVVCSEGSLGDAVRASMSFPLVFKPIEMNGVLVYDGGIYDNFPVDVMHDVFNPEFMIGVSVSGPDGKPEPGNVYSQLEDMIIQNNDYDLPEAYGVKIQVPVLEFGVLDWSEAETIYKIGYESGLAMVDSIKARCPYRRSSEELAASRKKFREDTPVIEFDTVMVEGATPSQDKYIKSLFTYNQNQPIGMERVKSGYYRAVTDGKFIDLLPQARFNNYGSSELLLKATVKQPWNVGIGGWITSSIQSQLFFTFGYHTLSLSSLDVDINGWIGQSYYAGMISGKIALSSKNPSALRLIGVVSRQKFYENELMFYQNTVPSFVNESQQFVRLEYSVAAGKPAKIYSRLSYGHIRDEYFADLSSSSLQRDRTDYLTTAVQVSYEYNTLSNQLYPMAGRWIEADILGEYDRNKLHGKAGIGEGKSDKSDYINHLALSAKVGWKEFFPLHKNFILGGLAEGLMTLSKPYQNYTATLIHAPAFAPTPSTKNYFNTAFRSDNYLAAGVLPIWNPAQKFQVRGDFYVYTPVRNLEPWGNGCRYAGWFRKAEFLGEIAAVYNFKFASLSLYCNYLSYPARNWNFGLNLGLLFQAPKLLR